MTDAHPTPRSRRPVAAGAVLLAALLAPLAPLTASAWPAAGPPDDPGPSSDLRQELGLSPDQQLVEKDRFTGPDGTEHVRYDRRLELPGGDEVAVLGGDLVVHGTGDPGDVTWAGPEQLTLDVTSPRVSADRAADLARTGERREGRRLAPAGEPVLAVDATGDSAQLVWQVPLGADPARQRTALISADDGDRIRSWRTNPGADEGVGRTLYSGRVPLGTTRRQDKYVLIDSDRGRSRTELKTAAGVSLPADADNAWGNGRFANLKTRLSDVHYGLGISWDFYSDVLGRHGIADDGRPMKGRLNPSWGGNAFWDDGCPCFEVGGARVFFGSTDVVGHEVSHGLVDATAELNYWGDAGGLNESTADIMGTLVEFHADNRTDKPDYRIGEQFYGDRKPPQPPYLRRMDRPSLDGVSHDCYSSEVPSTDAHYASGVGNHFFYLLAQGTGKKTFAGLPHNGVTCGEPIELSGIGNADAGRIWYDALRTYMVSTTSYPEARDATVRAAGDAFGPASAQCLAVEDAWQAVDVQPWLRGCSGPLELQPNQVANGDFENGLQGWRHRGDVTLADGPGDGHHALLRTPNSGDRATLRQTVTVPDDPAVRLSVRMRDTEPERVNSTLIIAVQSENGEREVLVPDPRKRGWTDYSMPVGRTAGTRATLVVTVDRRGGDTSRFHLDDLVITAPTRG